MTKFLNWAWQIINLIAGIWITSSSIVSLNDATTGVQVFVALFWMAIGIICWHSSWDALVKLWQLRKPITPDQAITDIEAARAELWTIQRENPDADIEPVTLKIDAILRREQSKWEKRK